MNYAPLTQPFVIPKDCKHITITLHPKKFNYSIAKRKLVIQCSQRIESILNDHCTSYHLILEFTQNKIPHFHGYVCCHEPMIYDSLFLRIQEKIGRVEISDVRDIVKFGKYCTDEIDRTNNILNYKYVKRVLTPYNKRIPIDIHESQCIDDVLKKQEMIHKMYQKTLEDKMTLLRWVHKLDDNDHPSQYYLLNDPFIGNGEKIN